MRKRNKNTKLQTFLFGDFDKDGVKNIDDPYPYDSSRAKYPSIHERPEFYHYARLGGTEVKLSEVLQKIQKANNKQAKHLRKFLRENPGSEGRVKTVASTIDKMYRKAYHETVRDVIAARITTKTRKEARKKFKKVKKRYPVDPTRIKDYYKQPKQGVHHALHLGLVTGTVKKGGKLVPKHMELQIQSKKMKEFDLKIHSKYKMGLNLEDYVPEASQLFLMGY